MNNMDEKMTAAYHDTVKKCGDEKMNAWQFQNTHAYFMHGWYAALASQPDVEADAEKCRTCGEIGPTDKNCLCFQCFKAYRTD